MLQGFFSLLLFIGILAGIGFGASWLIDNRAEVFATNEGPSIAELPMAVMDSGVEPEENELEREDEELLTINKEELEIAILNGGDEVGAAGAFAQTLTEAGYGNVTAGNASVYTYSNTTVYHDKQENHQVAEVVKAEIEGLFEERSVSVEQAENADQKSAPLTIILGESTE